MADTGFSELRIWDDKKTRTRGILRKYSQKTNDGQQGDSPAPNNWHLPGDSPAKRLKTNPIPRSLEPLL